MIENKLEKITKIILYLVPFLPLIFIEGYYFPFIITKTLYFRLLVELAGSFYLFLLILNFKKYKPRFNRAFIFVAVFVATNFIAGLTGLDFYKSFWSDFERMEGIIGYIILAAYLFLLLVILRTKKDWLANIRVILFVSLLVSLYGLVQKFSLLPVFQAGVNRIASTIGNAAFLAGFLLLAIGLGLYYYFNEDNKKYKIITLVIVGLDLVVLLLTATRGAILGLIFGCFIFLLISLFFSHGKIKKYSLIILLIFIVGGAGFYFSRSFLAKSKIELINRLATISLNDPTITNRLAVWQMAVSEFKQRPFLGVGLENFNIIYNKYFTPKISEDWFDRTHNIYLDQLVSSGLAGLAVYLIIFGYLFFELFKKRKSDYYQFAILTSLLVAYGLHNFFVFDTINTSFLYFFLIGFISFRVSEEKSLANQEKIAIPKNYIVNSVFLIVIIANIYIFYQLIYLPLKINRNLYIGYYYTLADTSRSYESFKTALSYKFGSVEAACQLAKMDDVLAQEPTTNKSDLDKFYSLTREKLEFASAGFPLEVRTKLYLGQLLLNNYKNRQDLDEAENVLKEAIKLSPGRSEGYYLLYNVYSRENDQARAEKILEDLITELPWFSEGKIMLATAIFKTDAKRADQLFSEAISQSSNYNESVTKKIIEYLLNAKKYKEAIPYYVNLIKISSERFDYRVDLAKIYYLTGDLNSAIEQINIVNGQSPQTLKGNEDFVNLLYNAYNKK